MGTHTTSDVVPFIAHNISEQFSSKMYLLWSPEEFAEIYAEEGTNQWYENPYIDNVSFTLLPNGKFEAELNGWNISDCTSVGKHKSIHGWAWQKDNLQVVLINESEYSAVGSLEASIVADDSESIVEFLKDMDLTARFGIEECDAAQETI